MDSAGKSSIGSWAHSSENSAEQSTPIVNPALQLRMFDSFPMPSHQGTVLMMVAPCMTPERTSSAPSERPALSLQLIVAKSNHMTLGHLQCSVRCAHDSSLAAVRAHGARYR